MANFDVSSDAGMHLHKFLLAHPKVGQIRFYMVDYNGVQRARLVTVSRAMDMAADPSTTGGVGTFGPSVACFTGFGSLIMDAFNEHNDHWVPDWTTLRLCAREGEYEGMVYCWAKESGKPEAEWYKKDPRRSLQAVERRARDQFGLDFLVGFEIEFCLLKSLTLDGLIETSHGIYTTDALRQDTFRVLEEAAEHLERQGVKVWGFHPEGGHSMFELSLAPQPPSQAVLDYYYATEVISDIAKRHGYYITRHPDLFDGKATIGQHLNISITDPIRGDQFLAGILARAKSLCAFLLGGYDSYSPRRRPSLGGGALTYGKWKLAPIRQREKGFWEFRVCDALTNACLQLAAIITAGLGGIEEQLELPMKPSFWKSFEPISKEHREECGITEDLPTRLEDSLQILKGEEAWWTERMGCDVLRTYVSIREKEVEMGDKMTENARKRAYVMHV